MNSSILRRDFIVGSLCLGSLLTVQAQKINKTKPGVYVTFRELVNAVGSDLRPIEGARLVLHNNTRWPIRYGEWMERALPGDSSVIYSVELLGGSIARTTHSDVVTNARLAPGKSVTFTVKRVDLPKDGAIFVQFDYSWELFRGDPVRNEAEHRAYFLSMDLPRWPEGTE